MPDQHLRCVIYGRVSADRVRGRSVDSQLDTGRQWAEHEGLQIVGVFRDDGISASRFANGKARPGWQDTVNLVDARGVDVLWLWELSRGTRDRVVYAALLTACEEAGVKIVLDDRWYDPRDPDDAYDLDNKAATAVLESGKTSKRVQRDVKARAAAGAPHGWVTYGYRSVYDTNTGKPTGRVRDPDTAKIVQEIVERILDGESVYSIEKDLNERGVPAPRRGPWRGANIQRLVCNPAYISRRVYQGEVQEGVEAKWPPLISEADHYRLIAVFDDPARRKYRQDTRVKHLGTGIFRCGQPGCDGRMRVLSPKNRPRIYSCRVCYKLSRLQEPVDELVEHLMGATLAEPDILELLAQADSDDTEAREAAEEVARLRGQLQELREKVDAGRLGLDDLEYFRARWEPQLRDAEERARPKSAPPLVFEVAGPGAERKWKRLTVVEKRTLIDALATVTILPAGRGQTEFDPRKVQIKWKTPR